MAEQHGQSPLPLQGLEALSLAYNQNYDNGYLRAPDVRRPSRTNSNSSGRPESLRLDTTPDTLSAGMASPFSERSFDGLDPRAPSEQEGSTSEEGTATQQQPPPQQRHAKSPAETAASSLASPAASSLMEGLAADMQARILALQQSRSQRRPTNGTPQPHGTLSRTSSNASAFFFSGPSSSSAASTSSSTDERRTSFSVNQSSRRVSAAGTIPNTDEATITPEKLGPNAGNGNVAEQPGSRKTSVASESGRSGFAADTEPKPQHVDSASSLVSESSAPVPFDPSKHVAPGAPTGGALALGRTPSLRTQPRSSLSERRGMRLSMPAAAGNGAGRTSGEPTVDSKKREVPVPNAGGNSGGLFSDYRKYIDVETGSLNFNGKACLHSNGIDFSSGTSFRISLDELDVLSELGSGNYGTVNKVLHTPTNVVMAMKEIRLELDEGSFRQIIMELDVLHRCHMANIVEFYGAFFVEGAVYICMEYMDGGSLNKIYRGGIPEPHLKWVVWCVVNGLKQLKEDFNIIHRDVKPTNILCSTSGRIKLCDFGVSGNLVASIAKTNIGCQAYMAPERIRGGASAASAPSLGPSTYTVESDVWSLGLSIIEMAGGEYPYPPETYSNIFSQLSAIVDGQPPQLDSQRYSAEACSFVAQLVAKNPRHRLRYAEMLRHPWLADFDSNKAEEDMAAFVRERQSEASQAHL